MGSESSRLSTICPEVTPKVVLAYYPKDHPLESECDSDSDPVWGDEWVVSLAAGLSTRGGSSNYVCSCPFGVDGFGDLCDDGADGFDRPDFQISDRHLGGSGRGTYRNRFYRLMPDDWESLGRAYVGNLVGLGMPD